MSSTAGLAAETVTYTYDALGRLTTSVVAGGPNNTWAVAACFDAAGNRTNYFTGTSTPPACQSGGGGGSGGNQPPVANADSYSLACQSGGTVNLTSNDTDPENNVPLALKSITRTGGADASASVYNASSAQVSTGIKGVTTFSYTVADSLGATSTAQLTITATGDALACTGGGTNTVVPPGDGDDPEAPSGDGSDWGASLGGSGSGR